MRSRAAREGRGRARRRLPLALLGIACAGCGAARDAVPESHDVRVVGAPSGANESSQGYVYVARRPLAVVALAEARGIDPEIAREAIDRVADALDACATDEGRRGSPVDGAARVVAQVDGSGAVVGTTVHVAPGRGVAPSAVVCLVAPVRLLAFPPVDAGSRGIAIEALWGRVLPPPADH